MMTIDHKLKDGFRKLFPEHAAALAKAKTQKEINVLHEKFIQEAKENLAKALGKKVSELTDTDQTAPIALKKEEYEILINATGDTIKNQLHVIIDGLERLKNMEDDDAGWVTAQILLSGVAALGGIAIAATQSALIVGAVEAAAAYAGVTAATVASVCAIAVLVIVLILIPILYFMEKPANCIVLLINELDQPLTFLEDYNEHGKPRLMTSPIPPAVVIPGVGTYPSAGLIATEKKEMALVGTQYGFVMKYKDKQFAFGVECPLTSIYEDNNCYCAIGQNAEHAANETAEHNTQFYEDSKDGITISIRCNSGSGSIAYYVARAYKK
jgi:hypothetical protein